MILQAVVPILILLGLLGNYRINSFFSQQEETFCALVSILIILSGAKAIALFSLALFHAYLLICARRSTYDWLQHKRDSGLDSLENSCREKSVSVTSRTVAELAAKRSKAKEDILIQNNARQLEKQKAMEEWQRTLDRRITQKPAPISFSEGLHRISAVTPVLEECESTLTSSSYTNNEDDKNNFGDEIVKIDTCVNSKYHYSKIQEDLGQNISELYSLKEELIDIET